MSALEIEPDSDNFLASYDVRRVRLFRQMGKVPADVLGVSANARALLASPDFHAYLGSLGYTVRTMAAAELADKPYTDFHVEIKPPLDSEDIQTLGELCVDGSFVESWARDQIDVDHHGVLVIDNRQPSSWPNYEEQTGGRIVASSILPPGTRLP